MTQTSPRIAILADTYDAHLPFVTRHLKEEPLIIDTGRILEGDHLAYRTRRHGAWPEIIYHGKPVGEIASIWCRNVSVEHLFTIEETAQRIRTQLQDRSVLDAQHQLVHELLGAEDSQYCGPAIPVEAVYQEYARSSLNRLALTLTELFPDAFWSSRREAIMRTSVKPFQQGVAMQLGFDVPETVTTSDAEEANAFLKEHGTCVVKPFALRPPIGYNQYTKVLHYTDYPDLSGLEVNPHIFQELITPAYELRVTVIGHQVFAAMVIDTQGAAAEETGVRDWRQAFDTASFTAQAVELPLEVAARCVQLVRRCGLATGMIDLIVDESGCYKFLEINASGQTAFIEEATGLPIGKALADMLTRRRFSA